MSLTNYSLLRRAVWRLGDDIRGRGAKILTRLWIAIGSPADQLPEGSHSSGLFQTHFVPSLVGEILTLCFSHHDELRNSAVFILFSMIVSEVSLFLLQNDVPTLISYFSV